jgi:hypothetical protein
VNGTRTTVLGALLALAVAITEQGLVSLVDASGARDQPALALILLLAAFLGLLTAVATRAFRLPSAVAPTALVVGWIAVPPLLALIPSAATSFFAGTAALSASDGVALVVATLAAMITLGMPADRRG